LSLEHPQSSRVGAHFRRGRASYDSEAVVHHEVAQALVARLEASSPSRVLEIGVHTGLLTKYWREIYPDSSAVLLDIWPGFRERCDEASNVGVLANGEQLPFKESSFDLVISGGTFQWYRDWETSVVSTLSLLKPEGTLAFSQFCEPSLEPFKSLVKDCGRESSFLPLKSHGEILNGLSQQQGFSLASGITHKTLYFDQPKSLVQHLRRLGVTASKGNDQPWSHSQWRQCVDGLEALRGKEGIPLRYAVGLYWLKRIN
jgi:malonyl-ACP O-methyltransferase BioC